MRIKNEVKKFCLLEKKNSFTCVKSLLNIQLSKNLTWGLVFIKG